MLYKKFSIIILAAGKGARMNSNIPKVLHKIGGKTMIQHVIDVAVQLKPDNIYIVCNYDVILQQHVECKMKINWVFQKDQLGTGHAVQQVIPNIFDDEKILILYADVPLISVETIYRLLEIKLEGGISLLSLILKDPDGYGRIIRKNQEVIAIVEQKDTDQTQNLINEVNSGILAIYGRDLKHFLNKVNNNNINYEWYLTDIISIAWNEGRKITVVQPIQFREAEGVNNHLQLARLERFFQKKQINDLLLDGVKFSDKNRFDLRGKLIHGKDVFIDINVIIEGFVTLGNRVTIGSGCILKNVVVGNDVIINPYTIIEDACLDSQSIVGPFARLRSGSKLQEKAYVGNFVEMKKTNFGKGSKACHFSYMGDVEIGDSVNIGAGTVTCNYDGFKKNKTIIGDNVFIGSNSQLIAPVTIGNNSTIGAGTTVTNNVQENTLVLSRIHQFSVQNWHKKNKKDKKEDIKDSDD